MGESQDEEKDPEALLRQYGPHIEQLPQLVAASRLLQKVLEVVPLINAFDRETLAMYAEIPIGSVTSPFKFSQETQKWEPSPPEVLFPRERPFIGDTLVPLEDEDGIGRYLLADTARGVAIAEFNMTQFRRNEDASVQKFASAESVDRISTIGERAEEVDTTPIITRNAWDHETTQPPLE